MDTSTHTLSEAANALLADSAIAIDKKGPPPRLTVVAFLIGPTCAGKSTFAEKAKEAYPGHIGLIQIGKAMRAKYPPSHFKGSGAPAHTQKEAESIFNEQFNALMGLHVDANGQRRPDMVLVDGIPRTVEQVKAVSKGGKGWVPIFVHMTAKADVLHQRASARHGVDIEALRLALTRIDNDRVAIHDLFPAICGSPIPCVFVATDNGVQVVETLRYIQSAADGFVSDLAEQEVINALMEQQEAAQAAPPTDE